MNFDEEDIENNWKQFKSIIIEARDQHVPHKLSTTRHNLPWYNQKLRKLGNKKQRLYNKSRKSKSREYIEAFKLCRAEFNKTLKQDRREYLLDFLEPRIDENGKLFDYIKIMKNDSVGIEALKLNGKLSTDPVDKAEALAQEYESVWKTEEMENIPNILPSPFPDMPDFEISEECVLKQLNGLNVHKSTGPEC